MEVDEWCYFRCHICDDCLHCGKEDQQFYNPRSTDERVAAFADECAAEEVAYYKYYHHHAPFGVYIPELGNVVNVKVFEYALDDDYRVFEVGGAEKYPECGDTYKCKRGEEKFRKIFLKNIWWVRKKVLTLHSQNGNNDNAERH